MTADFGYDLVEFARAGQLRPAIDVGSIVRLCDGTGPEAMYVHAINGDVACVSWCQRASGPPACNMVDLYSAEYAIDDLEPCTYPYDPDEGLIVEVRG